MSVASNRHSPKTAGPGEAGPGTFAEPAGGGLKLRERLAAVRDRFVQEWSAGRRPRIEDFLSDTAEPDRSTLFLELVKIEVELRRRADEAVHADEYISRFPEYARHLSDSGLVDAAGSAIGETIVYQPPAGDAAARFEVLELLGAGAFGMVWKARDRELDRLVALKRPRADRLDDRDAFLREARAAANLRHPNIVSVHQVGRDAETVYLVTDYIDGGSLRARLKERLFAPADAAALCATLADALQHAHERGVIHRDLKPSNILLDRAGEPHIADFGLAKRLASEGTVTAAGHIMGTVPYMSPEQADGRSHEVDARSDLFSLGVILYELLTGQRPFRGEDHFVLRQILNDDPPHPRRLRPEIPRDLETVCLKCLEKSPARRYQSATELAADLRRVLTGDPIHARRTSYLHRASRWTRRRAAVLGATSLSCACLAMVAVLFSGQATPGLLRIVELETDPPGAEVHFIPLNPITREPLPERIVDAGVSPVRVDLAPGDYLVVAVLDEKRFHEVYRHVPDEFETIPEFHNHNFWKVRPNGTFWLPQIRIPAGTVTDGMAFVTGASDFTLGIHGSATSPERHLRMPAYYIDPVEVSIADMVRLYGPDIRSQLGSAPTDDYAALAGWNSAIQAAERLGKRLPSGAEYEFAARERGRRQGPPPFTDEQRAKAARDFGPVGSPDFDRAVLEGTSVYGLHSNVAEWTSTPALGVDARTHRFVRGGDEKTILGDPRISPEQRDPRTRTAVLQRDLRPGLGFRCVRSAKPRLRFEDFEAPSTALD